MLGVSLPCFKTQSVSRDRSGNIECTFCISSCQPFCAMIGWKYDHRCWRKLRVRTNTNSNNVGFFKSMFKVLGQVKNIIASKITPVIKRNIK